jgi:hypothetical protein
MVSTTVSKFPVTGAADPIITVALLDAMAQYHRLTGLAPTPAEEELRNDALRYLDRYAGEAYDRLRNESSAFPSFLHAGCACAKKESSSYVPTVELTSLLHLRLVTYASILPAPEAVAAYRYFTKHMFALHATRSEASERGKTPATGVPLAAQVHAGLLAQQMEKRRLVSSLLERFRRTATCSPAQGMFWANARSADFLSTPLSIHSLLTDFFIRCDASAEETGQLLRWLLAQKQVQDWPPHPATLRALAMLLTHSADVPEEGKTPAPSPPRAVKHPKGAPHAVNPPMGVSIEREILPLDGGLHVGGRLLVRLTVRSDGDMSYVLLEDHRPACLAPSADHSGALFFGFFPLADGSVPLVRAPFHCYHAPRDASETFFIPLLPRGTHLIEYTATVTHAGRYAAPAPVVRSLYAPEVFAWGQPESIFVTTTAQ